MASCRPDDLAPAIQAGLTLIKIRPGRKEPYKNWNNESQDPTTAKNLMYQGYNIGWRLEAADLVIDVDPRNFREGDNPLERLVADTGLSLELLPHVLTAGGGHHYYLIKPPQLDILEVLPDYPGLEFKSLGRQVLLPGSYNSETKRYYEWDDINPMPVDRINAPDALIDLIQRIQLPAIPDYKFLDVDVMGELLMQVPVLNYTKQHDEWFKLMVSFHHGTQGLGGDIFEAWSRQDPAYAHDTEIRSRWNSLDANRSHGITVNTFYQTLRKLKIPIPGEMKLFEDNPLPALVDEGPASRPEPQTQAEKCQRVLEEMNEKHCTIFNGKFLVYTKKYNPELDRYYWSPATSRDFMQHYADKQIQSVVLDKNGNSKAQMVTYGDFWLTNSGRRKYENIVFAPNQHLPETLNLWQGFSYEPIQGNYDMFKKLMMDVLAVGDQEVYDYVFNWLAYTIQQPQHKAKVALVMYGEKGVGKGWFARIVLSLIRSHALQATSREQILGKFNIHMMDTKLLFADEAFWAGQKDTEGILKGLITEEFMSYEGKFQPVTSGRSCLNLIIASNHEWVIPASMKDERRFCVMAVSECWRETSNFDDLKRQMYQERGMEALMYDLVHIDLGDWTPWKKIPQTKGLAEQKLQSLDNVEMWWLERLESGIWHEDQIRDWNDGMGTAAPTELLYTNFLAFIHRMRRDHFAMSKQQFAMKLKKIYPKITARQLSYPDTLAYEGGDNQGRIRSLLVPSLATCRAYYDEKLGLRYTWEKTSFESIAEDFPLDSDIYA